MSVKRAPTNCQWEYRCLQNIHEVVTACLGEVRSVENVLVIQSEYRWLLETFEKGYLRMTMAIVIMGQPGIGSYIVSSSS